MQGVSLGQARRWARAEAAGPEAAADRPLAGVSTDSRSLRPGELFVALRGERFDGHAHLAAAFEGGAAAAMVARRSMTDGAVTGRTAVGPLMVVDSPLAGLGRMARHYRRRFDHPVVGITGSAGKTTAKEMIAAVLARRYRVLKTRGSENNEVGVPRTLLSMAPETDVAVLELAARHVGDIAYLCRIAQPTIGVLLNIGSAHAEVFGSVERVAKAKGELLDSIVDESYVALVNADDCVIAGEAMRTKGRLLGFGWSRESHFSGEGLVLDQEGCGHFSLQNTSFHLRIPGKHNASNALAAAAVGVQCGVPLEEAAAALADFEPVAMRSEILRKRGIRVINDCYNANPESMQAALDTAASIEVTGRRIAVLGDMLELGDMAAAKHEEIGRHAARCVDLLLATGSHSDRTVHGARQAGLPAEMALRFDDRPSLARRLKHEASNGDLVLVKASRGAALESVIDEL